MLRPRCLEQALDRSRELFGDRITLCSNKYDAVQGADALVIMTEWDEFKQLDWKKIYDCMLKPAFLFDGRRLLERKTKEEIGFQFYAIGS